MVLKININICDADSQVIKNIFCLIIKVQHTNFNLEILTENINVPNIFFIKFS